MSYRNPKFFNYNPLAGMEAAQATFDKVFGSAVDYFEEKRKNREDYVNDVDVASNKARTITSNLKNMGLNAQNVINEGIDGFMNDALRTTDDEGNLINRAYRKGELDQATTNFSNAITPFNTFFGLVPTIDYESGLHKSASSSYRQYAALIEQARSGLPADAFKMDQDGSKFNFSVTIANPDKNFDPDAPDTITIDADRLNQLIAENNPELLNQYRTRYDERFSDIKGTITTKLGVDKASFNQEQETLFNTGKDVDGKLFDANEYVRDVVNESVDLLKDTSRDGERTLVDDIYANDVDYGTDEMFRLLSDEKYIDSGNVFASIYRDLERAKDIEGLELLEDLLQTNYKDGTLNKKILNKLNITEETHRQVIKDLNAFKDDVVKEYLYDEMIGEGVASHWQSGKKQPEEEPTTPPTGSLAGFDQYRVGRLHTLYTSTIQPLSEMRLDFANVADLPPITTDDIAGMVKGGQGTQVTGKGKQIANEKWFKNIFSDQGTPDQVAGYMNDLFNEIKDLDLADAETINKSIASGTGAKIMDENNNVKFELTEDDSKLLQEYQTYQNKGMAPTVQLKQFFKDAAYDDVQYYPNSQKVVFGKEGAEVRTLNLGDDAEWDKLAEELAAGGMGKKDEIIAILNMFKQGVDKGDYKTKSWQALEN
jgi:hypothetical protein